METIYGAGNADIYNNGRLIIALGNFDGLHLAHREIIKRARQKAVEEGLKSAVFTLDPHPVKVLYPHKNVLLLSTLQERAEKMSSMGIDYLIVERFTKELSTVPPFQFVRNYLVDTMKAAGVVVGFDYTFGRRGRGSAADLLRWGQKFNFMVDIVPPVTVGSEVVSSSLIRILLAKGEVEEASRYLGYCFERRGRVIHGEGRGKIIGYPTANLDIAPQLLLPAKGVYLSEVSWKNRKLFGLTNIGSKPTFNSGNETCVEVHLLDFEGNLYGEELKVVFLQRIREEKAFCDAGKLKKQIEQDLAFARKYIENKYSDLKEKQCI